MLFLASHDYSRRFSGANLHIFFDTDVIKDKIFYKYKYFNNIKYHTK